MQYHRSYAPTFSLHLFWRTLTSTGFRWLMKVLAKDSLGWVLSWLNFHRRFLVTLSLPCRDAHLLITITFKSLQNNSRLLLNHCICICWNLGHSEIIWNIWNLRICTEWWNVNFLFLLACLNNEQMPRWILERKRRRQKRFVWSFWEFEIY